MSWPGQGISVSTVIREWVEGLKPSTNYCLSDLNKIADDFVLDVKDPYAQARCTNERLRDQRQMVLYGAYGKPIQYCPSKIWRAMGGDGRPEVGRYVRIREGHPYALWRDLGKEPDNDSLIRLLQREDGRLDPHEVEEALLLIGDPTRDRLQQARIAIRSVERLGFIRDPSAPSDVAMYVNPLYLSSEELERALNYEQKMTEGRMNRFRDLCGMAGRDDRFAEMLRKYGDD